MKIFCVIFMLFLMLCNSHAQWQTLNEGLPGSPEKIQFTSENKGWMSGYDNLFKTSDGGESWYRIPLPLIEDRDYLNFYFYNDSIGWVMGLSPYYSVSKSEDGGLSWSDVYYFQVDYENIKKTFQVSDSVVFIAGSDYGNERLWIARSMNRGYNWQDLQDSLFQNYWFDDMHFFDTVNGFILAKSDMLLTVLKTHDGGVSWKQQQVSGLSSITSLQVLKDSTIYFLAQNYYYDHSDYILGKTSDFFKTWAVIFQSSDPILSFYILQDSSLFMAIQDSLSLHIRKSVNDGLTWQSKYSMAAQTTSFNCSFCFTAQNKGFMLMRSEFDIIFKSSNNGENWWADIIGYHFADILFINENNGFAAGGFPAYAHSQGYGGLFSSSDGGNNWNMVLNPGVYIENLDFFNEKKGIILTGSGTIYCTNDQGKTWIKCYQDNPDSTGYSISSLEFGDIAFLNENTILAIERGSWGGNSNGAIIIASHDGGESWHLVWTKADGVNNVNGLTSICVEDGTAWIVGQSGLIVKSTDADVFTIIDSGTDLPLKDVFFADTKHGWVSGGYLNGSASNSILLKTDNSGASWQETALPDFVITDMYFADSLHGWAVGHDTSGHGFILHTEDGADTWQPQVEALSAPLNALYFKDGFGWAVGDNGLVLRTENGINWIKTSKGKTYPARIELQQNYPNPFNPKTNIEYRIPNSEFVNLSIYNLPGQKVATLVDKRLPAGSYTVQWDATNFSSGIYYYHLKAGEFEEVKKMVLIK